MTCSKAASSTTIPKLSEALGGVPTGYSSMGPYQSPHSVPLEATRIWAPMLAGRGPVYLVYSYEPGTGQDEATRD